MWAPTLAITCCRSHTSLDLTRSRHRTGPRRALIVFHELRVARGGMGRVGWAQAQVLESLGWEVTVMGSDSLGPAWEWNRVPALNPALSALQLSQWVQRKRRHYDLIFTHGLCGVWAPRRGHVHMFHGTCAGLARSCRRFLSPPEFAILAYLNSFCEWAAGRLSTGLAVSGTVAEEVERWLGLPRPQVLYNGVDEQVFRPQRLPRKEKGFWGFIAGRMDIGKGRLALAALGPLLGEEFGVKLAAQNVHQDSMWPGSRTQLLGAVAYSDMPEAYGQADYLLNLSRYEGFGLTVIEAWACGLPVVSSNVGIVRELRGQEASLDALVVDDPDDSQGFAHRIQLLRDTPELGKRQVEWARALVEQRFTLRAMRSSYQQLIERIQS